MRIDAAAEPIVDDDATIRASLVDADVPALVVAVASCTGELDLLRPEFRPDPARLLEPEAGIEPAAMDQARQLAAEALIRFRDAGSVARPAPDDEELHELLSYLVGPGAGPYGPVLREELAIDGVDRRAPTWRKDDVAPDTAFSVAVIGAGMSGLAAAHRLGQAGVDVTVFEKNDDVGGTWFENTYPGCRVDVPNHLYSYSFAQTPDWPQFFSTQDVLLEYFRSCADRFGLRERIVFGTAVEGAAWDDDAQQWVLRLDGPDGRQERRFHALVSAVGQLNEPSFPTIEGRERFTGPSFHSARWDHDVDLRGRRVAVIGTGASAVQFVPPVAAEAAEVVVFQRTPPWLAPSPTYMDDVPDTIRWVLRHVPGYARWDRLWQFWKMHEGLLPAAEVDPDWHEGERSVSAINDLVREMLTLHLREVLPEPDLFERCLPHYPPIAKRIVRDNGAWTEALRADHVDLVSDRIDRITETGVVTVDAAGVETSHDVDVLIYGTGFAASSFLTPMRIEGRGGVDLHERWAGDARAYLGITVPDFPNLFLLYGPNTNIVINGSIIYFSECEVHYLVESVQALLAGGHASMDCRADVHDAYNRRIDEGNRAMAWGASAVSSWYKNANGRVAQNWPFSLLEYWQQTRTPDLADYVLR